MAKTAPNKLTPKQEMFCREYLIDLNATQAAIRAGYSARTAEVQGFQLLKKTLVAERISELKAERAARVEVTADYVLETITDTIERCRQAKPVYDRQGNAVMVETANGDIAPVYRFDPFAVLKGAELLGKHLGILADKLSIQNPDGSPINSRPDVSITFVQPGDGDLNRKPTE